MKILPLQSPSQCGQITASCRTLWKITRRLSTSCHGLWMNIKLFLKTKISLTSPPSQVPICLNLVSVFSPLNRAIQPAEEALSKATDFKYLSFPSALAWQREKQERMRITTISVVEKWIGESIVIRGEKNIVKKVAVKINVVLVKVKIGIVPPLELKEGIPVKKKTCSSYEHGNHTFSFLDWEKETLHTAFCTTVPIEQTTGFPKQRFQRANTCIFASNLLPHFFETVLDTKTH
mgnify:CR=1 FL=1